MGLGAWSADTKSKQAEAYMPIAEVETRFRVDFEKGEVFNRVTGTRLDKVQYFKGQTPNSDTTRYRQISCRSTQTGETIKISAHRLIWAAKNRTWPGASMVIDHIDGNRQNNAISNLREITQGENISHGRR